MKKNVRKKQKLLSTAIMIVSALLLINLLLLSILLSRRISTARTADHYTNETQRVMLPAGSATCLRAQAIPLRLLSSGQSRAEEKLSLTFWNGYGDTENFSVTNLLPGDSETKKYTVTVKRSEAAYLVFDLNIKHNSLLSQALILKVVADGNVLYDDILSHMPPLSVNLESGATSQEVIYEITATLPVRADNSVANLTLSVDFSWALTDEPSEPFPSIPGNECNSCIIDKIIERFTNQVDERCPICDAADYIFLTANICICPYGCLLVITMIILTTLLIVLSAIYFVSKRREMEEDEYEDETAETMTDTDNDPDTPQ